MPDNKRIKWADSFGAGAVSEPTNAPAANDADGWQQYRHWIAKAPTPKTRRSGIDPSLFSWKGYRDWSDQVKRTWDKDSKKHD
jgi:hypothetical protein